MHADCDFNDIRARLLLIPRILRGINILDSSLERRGLPRVEKHMEFCRVTKITTLTHAKRIKLGDFFFFFFFFTTRNSPPFVSRVSRSREEASFVLIAAGFRQIVN
ncbi:hypothetical protein PUN28_019852 [Cardiocondyla obscurior]|uniref:Uncharacterized protein n=1 Tax=Cardiocondyla obscurior TaxID=286306 RepID=A0AAW2E916_9HYME